MHHGTGEAIKARYVWQVGRSANPGSYDDVARMQDSRLPAPLDFHSPPLRVLFLSRAQEVRTRPDIELEGVRVELEPGSELILGGVTAPGWRERQEGQVIGSGVIMQAQGMVAVAPVVTDPR